MQESFLPTVGVLNLSEKLLEDLMFLTVGCVLPSQPCCPRLFSVESSEALCGVFSLLLFFCRGDLMILPQPVSSQLVILLQKKEMGGKKAKCLVPFLRECCTSRLDMNSLL